MYLVKPKVLTRAQTNWNNHDMNMYGGTRVINHQQYFICTLGGGGGRMHIQNVWLRFDTLLHTQFLDKENNDEKQEIALRNPGLAQ